MCVFCDWTVKYKKLLDITISADILLFPSGSVPEEKNEIRKNLII